MSFFVISPVHLKINLVIMMIMMMMVIMTKMNCFCKMIDRRKTFSRIFNRDHCQWLSPSQISDTTLAELEPAQNLKFRFCWIKLYRITQRTSTRTRRQNQSRQFGYTPYKVTSLHKKWSFPLWMSSTNVTRSCGFGHIYWRNS